MATLRERIAALQQRSSSPSPSQIPVPKSDLSNSSNARLKDKIAKFEKRGGTPVPRGSFGLGAAPGQGRSSSREYYGNRFASTPMMPLPSESSSPKRSPSLHSSSPLAGNERPPWSYTDDPEAILRHRRFRSSSMFDELSFDNGLAYSTSDETSSVVSSPSYSSHPCTPQDTGSDFIDYKDDLSEDISEETTNSYQNIYSADEENSTFIRRQRVQSHPLPHKFSLKEVTSDLPPSPSLRNELTRSSSFPSPPVPEAGHQLNQASPYISTPERKSFETITAPDDLADSANPGALPAPIDLTTVSRDTEVRPITPKPEPSHTISGHGRDLDNSSTPPTAPLSKESVIPRIVVGDTLEDPVSEVAIGDGDMQEVEQVQPCRSEPELVVTDVHEEAEHLSTIDEIKCANDEVVGSGGNLAKADGQAGNEISGDFKSPGVSGGQLALLTTDASLDPPDQVGSISSDLSDVDEVPNPSPKLNPSKSIKRGPRKDDGAGYVLSVVRSSSRSGAYDKQEQSPASATEELPRLELPPTAPLLTVKKSHERKLERSLSISTSSWRFSSSRDEEALQSGQGVAKGSSSLSKIPGTPGSATGMESQLNTPYLVSMFPAVPTNLSRSLSMQTKSTLASHLSDEKGTAPLKLVPKPSIKKKSNKLIPGRDPYEDESDEEPSGWATVIQTSQSKW